MRTAQLLGRRVLVMAPLGFASGLPLALSGATLQAWLTVSGVDLAAIGLYTLVGLPYTFKFLWSPLMDRFVPPWLDRRRGWMLAMQLALAAAIAAMAALEPAAAPLAVAALALAIAFASASQDIAFDAYRADVLRPAERGLGAAVSVAAYRVAMLVSGAGALVVAERAGWPAAWLAMALLMAVGVAGTLAGPAPERPAPPPASLAEAVGGPFRAFFRRRGAWALLALVVLYKLGDAFAGTLTTAFLIRGVGLGLAEVGLYSKVLGLAALLAGALWGGAWMARLGLWRALMLFGLLQALTNLGFLALLATGPVPALVAAVVGLENLAGGMGTAAFVALLMGLCDHRYTATQFALLSALAAVGRVLVGPGAGLVAEHQGWAAYFLASFAAALPGLVVLAALRPAVEAAGADGGGEGR